MFLMKLEKTCLNYVFSIYGKWAIPEKKKTRWGRGGWGHGISRSVEERTCGNSRVYLKKKRNFQGCSRKNYVEFPCFLVFEVRISQGYHTILQNFQGFKLVFSRFSKGKVTILKIPGGREEGGGGGQESISSTEWS